MKKFFTLILSFLAVTTASMADDNTSLTIKNEQKLFESNSSAVGSSNPTHRIPAIACKGDTIIAISDERYSTNGGDIGTGRIDLVYRLSTDNGKTWGEKGTVVQGGKDFNNSTSSNFGYGDAAVCIDRTTGKILVMAAAGTTAYSSSAATNSSGTVNVNSAIRIAKITGTINSDGTVTWSSPVDMSSTIYGLYTYTSSYYNYSIYVTKAFFGSGRLCQSSLIRHGSGASYRVYGALTTNRGSVVVFSDDFGETWSTLGSASDQPSYSTSTVYGDEAKVEELGNADVLLCAKNINGTGRIYNIYHYSDIAPSNGDATTGAWQTLSTSTINAARCNGEIYMVQATNNIKDHANYGKDAYVMLLSVPASSSRENVSIYWKAINDRDDTNEVSDYSTASNWTQVQISNTTSAYSTMRQDGNGDIAFLYEENNYPHNNTEAYDIVFKTISLSDLTGGQYTADDPWEKRVVTLKAKILKNGNTISYYMRNKQAEDGTASVELEMVNADNVTNLDYSYYWVISKAPANAVNDQYYYISSYQGDGYLGQVMATDSYSGVEKRNGAGSTEDYTYEFKIRGFVKKGTQQNGHTDTSSYPNIATTGYSLNFLDLYDTSKMYKNKYIAISEAGTVNWYDHSTTGENMNGAGVYWTTDFEITDVTEIQNPTTATATCGTKDAPTEYGWPVVFTRHDNNYNLQSYENWNYYATLKLPWAVALPEGIKAYWVSKKLSVDNQTEAVGLTEMTLETNDDGLKVLPRETPVLLVMTNTNAGTDGKTRPTDSDVQKTVYLRPDHARRIQTTNFGGTLGKKIDTSYNDGYHYLLSKMGGRVAFRYMTGTTIGNNKAFYVFDSTSGAKPGNVSFFFTDDETTGLLSPELPVIGIEDDTDAPVYDLTGRRVSHPTQKGVYIKNGRKWLVK